MKTERNYIYLTNEDKTKIFKQAWSKQLSVSTYVSIIHELYKGYPQKDYLCKGQNRICIKTAKEHKDIDLTNSVFLFLHNDKLKSMLYNNENKKAVDTMITNMNRKIQSKADSTYDKMWNYNTTIRATYRKGR